MKPRLPKVLENAVGFVLLVLLAFTGILLTGTAPNGQGDYRLVATPDRLAWSALWLLLPLLGAGYLYFAYGISRQNPLRMKLEEAGMALDETVREARKVSGDFRPVLDVCYTLSLLALAASGFINASLPADPAAISWLSLAMGAGFGWIALGRIGAMLLPESLARKLAWPLRLRGAASVRRVATLGWHSWVLLFLGPVLLMFSLSRVLSHLPEPSRDWVLRLLRVLSGG